MGRRRHQVWNERQTCAVVVVFGSCIRSTLPKNLRYLTRPAIHLPDGTASSLCVCSFGSWRRPCLYRRGPDGAVFFLDRTRLYECFLSKMSREPFRPENPPRPRHPINCDQTRLTKLAASTLPQTPPRPHALRHSHRSTKDYLRL